MYLGDKCIVWSASLRYLGITFTAGSRMLCDVNAACRKFYAASNTVFCHSSNLDELMQLHLQQSDCLPVLTYATAALYLTQSQSKALNVCWNNVYRKIFKFHHRESVTTFIGGLGFLNFVQLWHLSVFKFVKVFAYSSNSILKSLIAVYVQGEEWLTLCRVYGVSLKFPLYGIRQSLHSHMFFLSNVFS